MQIIIKTDGLPISRQIANQIRHRILTGNLKVSHEVPAVPELAKTLRVNPNTVARAYHQLEREGMLEKREDSEIRIVSRDSEQHILQGSQRLEHHLDSAIQCAIELGFSIDELTDLLRRRNRETRGTATEQGRKIP